MQLFERLRALIPTREQIHSHRGLAWLGPRLLDPRLWRWSRRTVSLGVALGVFFGLLVPVAQIPLSVGAAAAFRANVPAAAASTLVTNPVTFGPVYYAAYRLGNWLTGEPSLSHEAMIVVDELEAAVDISLWQRILSVGRPLLLGLAITATLMGLLTYGLVSAAWRWRVVYKWRNRTRP